MHGEAITGAKERGLWRSGIRSDSESIILSLMSAKLSCLGGKLLASYLR